MVNVDLGVLSPAGTPEEWGGVLHRVPQHLAAAMRSGGGARLRFPNGQERRVHPVGQSHLDDRGRLFVPFMGEGPSPAA